MPEFVVDNLREGYRQIVAAVERHGDRVTARDLATTEIRGASIVLTDPRNALPVGVGRGVNTAIAAVEALQLIGGESAPDLVLRIAPQFEAFMDDGEFHGAYGPRMLPQIFSLLYNAEQPGTRRALATLWDPERDQLPGKHDYPCTTGIQLLPRGGRLDMQVTMRSNDVWRGLAYDAFQFTQLQIAAASVLGLGVGVYRHHAASLHLYDSDLLAVSKMLASDVTAHQPQATLARRGGDAMDLVTRARKLLKGALPPATMSPGEQWYADVLAPYL